MVSDWPTLSVSVPYALPEANFKPGGWDVVPRIRVSYFGTPEL